ncbi:MAG: carboxypeptidase regulatory-like domain-containing protein [Planctomycetes bacterium]|nr:carboxypeptidase regulatory-like domain-containing protein [Planctomycetota bacterium]
MKLKTLINVVATGLACLGMILPADLMAAPPQTKSSPGRASLSGTTSAKKGSSKNTSKRSKIRVIDVELTKDGRLQGQVINAKKESVKEAVVSVRTAKQEIGRSLSTESGKFSIEKMPAGTFYIVAGSGHGVYRLWKNGKAPKSARNSIRIVSDRAVIRGQDGGTVLYDEDGTAYGQVRIVDNAGLTPLPQGAQFGATGGGMLDGLGVYDALLIAGILTAVTFGIINYNKNDDIENTVNALPNTTN